MGGIVWAAIHRIESATKKNALSDLGREELEGLVIDVYEMLNESVL